jgi:hypothetical protein
VLWSTLQAATVSARHTVQRHVAHRERAGGAAGLGFAYCTGVVEVITAEVGRTDALAGGKHECGCGGQEVSRNRT